MGLAPSGNGENPGKSAVAKVPVPIFSRHLRERAFFRGAKGDYVVFLAHFRGAKGDYVALFCGGIPEFRQGQDRW
jgi:hypothetical protein